MYEQHLDALDGLPITSAGEYDPDAGASWDQEDDAAIAGCAPPVARAAGDGALTGDVVERVRIGPYTADVQLERRAGGLWIACAVVETQDGVLSWCGAATEQEVAQRLAARRRRLSATAGFDFGNFLNSLGQQISQGTQQLARNRALRRTVRDVTSVFNRSELQPVFAVAQQIPYLGQALGAVRAAATMADQVLNGNPAARGRLQNIRDHAQRGNPVARQALEVLNDVLQAQRSSAQQRAGRGGPPPRASRRQPARRRAPRRGSSPQRARRPGAPRRGPSRDAPSRRGTRRPGPPRRGVRRPDPPRRRARRPAPGRRGGRSSGAEELAWREASQRWLEHARHARQGPLVTPAPYFTR